MHPDILAKLWGDRKINNCLRKTTGQGVFRRNCETAERLRILCFELQSGVVTHFSWTFCMHPDHWLSFGEIGK